MKGIIGNTGLMATEFSVGERIILENKIRATVAIVL